MCWLHGALAAGPDRRHKKSAIFPWCRKRVRMAFWFHRCGPHRSLRPCTGRVLPSNPGYRGRAPEVHAAAQWWRRGLAEVGEISPTGFRVLLHEPPHSHVAGGETPCLSAPTPDPIVPVQACVLTHLVPTRPGPFPLQLSGRILAFCYLHSLVPGSQPSGGRPCRRDWRWYGPNPVTVCAATGALETWPRFHCASHLLPVRSAGSPGPDSLPASGPADIPTIQSRQPTRCRQHKAAFRSRHAAKQTILAAHQRYTLYSARIAAAVHSRKVSSGQAGGTILVSLFQTTLPATH